MFLSSTSIFWTALCVVTLWYSAIEGQFTASGLTAIDRTGWTVTADSFQPGNEAVNVLDNDGTTIWHTQWAPSVAALPHTITLDMKNTYWVNGFTYLPRQDGNKNGN